MFNDCWIFAEPREPMFECHTDNDVSYYLDHRTGLSWSQVIVKDDPAGVELEFLESFPVRSF